jgi:hypothetical protein
MKTRNSGKWNTILKTLTAWNEIKFETNIFRLDSSTICGQSRNVLGIRSSENTHRYRLKFYEEQWKVKQF